MKLYYRKFYEILLFILMIYFSTLVILFSIKFGLYINLCHIYDCGYGFFVM